MLTIAISSLVVVVLMGALAVIHSARHAVVGYEDTFGFHEGTDPRAENAILLARATTQDDAWANSADEASHEHSLLPAPIRPASI
jgi:hypothetical protein